jgi:uncharacterized membrane protein (UPF0127 family)
VLPVSIPQPSRILEAGFAAGGLVFATMVGLGFPKFSTAGGERYLMSFDRDVNFPRVRAWVWIIAVAAVALCAFAGPRAQAASVQPLEIVTKNGVQVFSVEIATTEQEKETGLMYRKELADGKGMLFDFSPEQEVSMWMKNTYISLDMIFIRADGTILRIAESTEPLSTKIIPSQGLAKGVLEVIAGTAKKYGIEPGDRVGHPLFNGH